MLDGPIIRALGVIGKIASRQLAHLLVISDALAAHALAGAGLIRAVTVLHITGDIFAISHMPETTPLFSDLDAASTADSFD